MLGSDAEIVVRTSPVPVLLVRSSDEKAAAKKKSPAKSAPAKPKTGKSA